MMMQHPIRPTCSAPSKPLIKPQRPRPNQRPVEEEKRDLRLRLAAGDGAAATSSSGYPRCRRPRPLPHSFENLSQPLLGALHGTGRRRRLSRRRRRCRLRGRRGDSPPRGPDPRRPRLLPGRLGGEPRWERQVPPRRRQEDGVPAPHAAAHADGGGRNWRRRGDAGDALHVLREFGFLLCFLLVTVDAILLI
jgi:hypothetical protein